MKIFLLILSLAIVGCDSNIVTTANFTKLHYQFRTQCFGDITLGCRVMELNYQMTMAKYYRNVIEEKKEGIVDCNGEEFYFDLVARLEKQIGKYLEAKPGWFKRTLFSGISVEPFKDIRILVPAEYDHLISTISECDVSKVHDEMFKDTVGNAQSITASSQLSTSLEDIFGGIDTCSFNKNLIAIRDDLPTYKYFIERDISPYKIEQSLQYFNVDDELFGVHVSEVIVPYTWNMHAVTFDVPQDELLAVLREKFGEKFDVSEIDGENIKPKISKDKNDPQKSILFCDDF